VGDDFRLKAYVPEVGLDLTTYERSLKAIFLGSTTINFEDFL